MKAFLFEAAILISLIFTGCFINPVIAEYQVPVDAKFATLTITLTIPASPRWAHDIVLNASIAWNNAQAWYAAKFQNGSIYRFVEAPNGSVQVSFVKLSPLVLGLTTFTYSKLPSDWSTGGVAISARIQLSTSIFSQTEENNNSNRIIAFIVALHELGHTLGLGETLRNPDVSCMSLQWNHGEISTLDLYAIHLLAALPSGSLPPSFIAPPATMPYELLPGTIFI